MLLRVCRRAPHHHVEHLLFLEQVADLNARQQGRRRPAHIAGFDAVLLRRGQIDLDLPTQAAQPEDRYAQPATPSIPVIGCLTSSALAAEDIAVVSPKTRTTSESFGSVPDLAALLFQIGLHVVVDPGVAVDHILDLAAVVS